MQNTITERISVLIETMGENANSFSKKIGVSQSTIATALKRNKGVNSELLEKILIAFPLINNDWLLTGKGETFKNSTNILTGNNNAVQSNTGSIGGHQVTVSGSDYEKIIDKDKIEIIRSEANKMCLQEVASLKAEISRLEAIIKSKDQTIAAKDETIEILKSKK